MRRKVLLYILLLSGNAAHALTLQEAYQASLSKMESMAISLAEVERAEKEYWRRMSLVFPTLSAKGSEFIQDVPPTAPGDPVGSTLVRRSTPAAAIELKYTLFSGL